MKNELAESLRQLMLRSLFEKITIRQICERAGVIRATFYNYFDDKYDCLDWIVYHDMVEKNEDRINMNGMDSPVYDVLETIAENRASGFDSVNITAMVMSHSMPLKSIP